QNLMESLARKGAEIHIFARKWSGSCPPGVTVHRVGGPAWPSFAAYASFVALVGRAVREGGFDLVQSNERTLCQHIYRAGDGVHARWLELRLMREGFWKRLSIRTNPFHAYRLRLEKRLFEDPRLKAVVVNSEMVRGEILSRFRISGGKIRTVYNGVDLQRFHPANRNGAGMALRRRNGVEDGTPVVLFVGSGFDRKGLRFAIEGLARAAGDARLWVVGKGRTGRFLSLAEKLGVSGRIRFFGPQGDVAPFFAAADCFVLPTMYDPFPTAVLEAMAAGLPVVTTAQCGASEIIEPGREGFVLPWPDRTDSLADCMKELFDPERRLVMGMSARKRAEDFPMERTVAELEKLYGEILGDSAAIAAEEGFPG
ncbi:MAG: glycosyltransferase family 4 protein, partial [Syntrophobacteraceae bacterium]